MIIQQSPESILGGTPGSPLPPPLFLYDDENHQYPRSYNE